MIGGHDHFPHTQYQGETLIHKSGLDGRYLFRLQFEIEKRETEFKGKIHSKINIFTTWKMIANRGYEPDPETAKVVKFYVDQLPKESTDPLALISLHLSSQTESLRSKETNMGNLVADAVRRVFNSDFGFISGGNIRGDSFYSAGSV
jgi:5'-nucleotidase / UDP-sugar diphosphatase